MPGEFTMEQPSAVASQDVKKDRSHAQEGHPSSHAAMEGVQATPLTNGLPPQDGPKGVLPNGTVREHHRAPITNGASLTANTMLAGPENPPPLDQSWRQHDNNKLLGRMIERVAQKCYKDLNVTLTKMSEIDIEPQHKQANGVLPHARPDTSQASIQKKRLLMDFAKTQRDTFMKTAVLADWSRNEIDQGKLIDIKVWQDKQRNAEFSATRAVGQTKVNMIPAKVPAPNLEGGMELLGTSKAPWVPHMGYIVPKRSTAKQLLKLLRNMNVILATRLNLHEDLPNHLNDFTIGDGRATFTVKDEFEVDLSVADEDPATPFYFIDIRLLFTPAPADLHERFRGFLEAKVNHELATNGLRGCYDFLHNFVVTHKINVLRSQSRDLIHSRWFDCIQSENMRRNLIVRYWAGMPGQKSWIEIGVGSGKKGGSLSRAKATPEICIRWFRKSIQVTSEDVQFDKRNLSLEMCLLDVIRRHVAWVLSDLQKRIQTSAGDASPTTVELESSEDMPALVLNHPSLKEALQVRIEPITGRFSITPPSLPAANVERVINTNATTDVAKQLASLVCAVTQARLLKEAELLGWKATPNLTRQGNMQTLFGQSLRYISVFTPSQAWGENWALAVTFTLGGEKFWAVSLDGERDEQGNIVTKFIATVRRISNLDETKINTASSRPSLVFIEKAAVAEVAFRTLTKQLNEMHIPYALEDLHRDALSESDVLKSSSPAMAMYIRFSSLMKTEQKKPSKAWAGEMLRLTHHGISSNTGRTGQTRHDIRLTLEPGKISNLREHLTHHGSQDLVMNSTGGLALRMLTPFGQPFADQLQERLHNIERLNQWVGILQKRGFKCKCANLSKLTFTYNDAPELGAQLKFSAHGSLPITLRLFPPATNPHQRIRVILEQSLNKSDMTGFTTLTGSLPFTLPTLTALTRLECTSPISKTLAIHFRTPFWYTLKYLPPLPPCVFQVKAKVRNEGNKRVTRWHVTAAHSPVNVPEPLTKALAELWLNKGEHWQGLRVAALADIEGCGIVLEKIDELVRELGPQVEMNGGGIDAAAPVTDAVKSLKEEANPKVSAGFAAGVKKARASPAPPVKIEPDVIMLD